MAANYANLLFLFVVPGAYERCKAARRSVQHPYVNLNSVTLESVKDFESIFGRGKYCYIIMGGRL